MYLRTDDAVLARSRGVARLTVFNGRGRERSCRLVACDKNRVSVAIESELDSVVEPPIRVELFQGIGRGERMEWLIQKATELGLGAIRPWVSERADRAR